MRIQILILLLQNKLTRSVITELIITLNFPKKYLENSLMILFHFPSFSDNSEQ